ncbi:hypothetical protein R5R35_013184 [Gryllus longicercus]
MRRAWTVALQALTLMMLVAEATSAETVVVKVAQGQLRANVRHLRGSEKQMLKCSGIPYAEPPVGPNRFKDAVPAAPWEGERSCSSECSECAQPLNPAAGSFSKGSEDCLCLNVYAPFPLLSGVPVMVWIHGGAFVSGDGGEMIYGTDSLVNEDVVVVTLNYRLGALGFLNLGTEEAPGNQGLKDQLMALRWVKNNIAAFGGHPENITIFGESAGSASVHYHTISPESEGLFSAAILESGSALNGWAFKNDTRSNVKLLLKAAKCDPATASEPAAAVACLRAAPARALIAPQTAFKSDEDKQQRALIAFPPSVDGRFLAEEPCALVAKRSGAAVRTMAGFNSAEGIISIALARFKGGMAEFDAGLTEGRGLCLPCEPCPASRSTLRRWAAETRRHFLAGQPLAEDTLQGYVAYSTYNMFFRGILDAVRARAKSSTVPHFFYEFDVQSELNFAKMLFGGQEINGSSHADELGYLFHNKLQPSHDFANDSVEVMTRQRLLKLWTNFAKTGDPTPEVSDLLPVKWEPFSLQDEQYLYIGNTGVEMRQHPLRNDCSFFESLWKDVS